MSRNYFYNRSHTLKKTYLLVSIASLIGLGVAPSAFAQAQSKFVLGVMPVIATVIPACLVTATPMNFGATINAISDVVPTGVSSVDVLCTSGTAYTIYLDAGLNAGGSANYTRRSVALAGAKIGYQLYHEIGRTTQWDVTGSPGVGDGTSKPLNVYGQLNAASLAAAAPGAYVDSVTVTVTY